MLGNNYANTDPALKQPVVDACLDAVKDHDAAVRHNALQALAHARDPRALSPLISTLRNCTPDDRPAVVNTLKAISGQDFSTDANRWQAWLTTRAAQPVEQKK